MDGATTAHLDSNMDPGDRHPVVSFLSAFFWVVLYLLSWVKALIAFATITIPRMIYSILSYSLTLTLNFWSFAVIFVLSAIALNYWIRFRYLNIYTHLKEPPLMKPDAQELHPDVNTTETPPDFHNYLDEFLQAVRVFGFLEKPVFHELARHLQTRRLIAGDSISLDQDKSFYCVVDGMVQVYAPSGKPAEFQSGAWDNEDMNGYELMNEVGSGGTLSSLFTILSLFTEDVKMSWQGGETDEEESIPTTDDPSRPTNRPSRADSDVSQLDLDLLAQRMRSRSPSVSSSGSTVHGAEPMSPPLAHLRSPRTEASTAPQTPRRSVPPRRRTTPKTQIHHGTVARATEDSTLAVIPAEAFRRLTKKFPKASAHIVQVIMTRFSRVTFNAAHKYLGLTAEVLRTEKAINDIACHPLPRSFYEGGGMQQLRQRFDGVSKQDHDDVHQEDYFSRSSSSSSLLAKSPAMDRLTSAPNLTDSPVPAQKATFPPVQSRSSRHLVQAGDLHSSTTASDAYRPISRSLSVLNTPSLSRREIPTDTHNSKLVHLEEDDFDLREEVMRCIAVSIGLSRPPLSGDLSVEASPAFSATEGGRTTRAELFPSSFGSLSLLDMGDDGSSMTGGSSSITANGGYMNGLDNEVEILFYSAGTHLAKAGERDTGLFYVIEGFLDISLPSEGRDPPEKTKHSRAPTSDSLYESESDDGSSAASGRKTFKKRASGTTHNTSPPKGRQPLFTVKPGGIAGYLASLSHTASYVDIVAKTDTYVGFLPHHALERLLEKQPIVLLTLAKRLISLLSPLVLQIDASLDWMQVNAGQVLWRDGDVSDSFYIVINGRLRAITESEQGGVNIVAEYGQGDTAGEIDVITSTPRRNTVHAIRDTELIRMPQTLFNAISSRNPQTTALLLRMIASRVRSEIDSSSIARSRNTPTEIRRNNANLKTVAVLPVSRSVPVDAFARKLHSALESIGASTSYLNQASVSSILGRHAFTRMGKLKTAAWLADQEQRYKIVLYVADSAVSSSWTQTCVRQADYVLLVGMGDDPSIGEYERLLLSMKTTARKELVLLHPDRSVLAGSTREWLKSRPWVHQHIHVELPGLKMTVPKPSVQPPSQDPAAVAALKTLKDRVQNEIQKYRGSRADVRPQRQPHSNDFARVARRICGTSIGLVLGGGGARGISHLGVLRALEEFGVPIDHIGGTSIGAFIGGLYAKEGDLIWSAGRAKQFSGRMGNIWRMLSDVTYPLVAYTTGHEFNRSLYKAFYDLHIEDMWLPFFCNSANINNSRMEIHETGYAWRFIRASMTLVGLLPPLCDNGNMLVDGGYLDNLPVSTMFDMGASAVFAADVGSIDDNSPRNFGDTVSGWWLLVNRWNPFSNARTIPAITEIQSRLAYVSSVRTLEEAKVSRGCLYMAVPVQEYGTLQWSKYEEIQQKGYEEALKMLEKWEEEGKLPSGYIEGKDAVQKGKKKGQSARRNSI
ncbi:patatin-domain-containing protein [Auriscalpium vulgare]|uniref:Patatin-domain-containing protein n=1 Tax=Auriscalpium vulgare TaxID=40419 RepID=A0ACB8RZL1_9AGAM|nr:patatin-domain-containing protein [Auriscalpium vulgare]